MNPVHEKRPYSFQFQEVDLSNKKKNSLTPASLLALVIIGGVKAFIQVRRNRRGLDNREIGAPDSEQ